MKALVISGGGSKGAFAGGVAQFLIEENEINIGNQLLIKGVTTGEQKIELKEMLVNGAPSEKAIAGDTCTFKLPFRIRLSDKLYKIIE